MILIWIYDLELQSSPAACIAISWHAIYLKTADNFKIQDISLSVPFSGLWVECIPRFDWYIYSLRKCFYWAWFCFLFYVAKCVTFLRIEDMNIMCSLADYSYHKIKMQPACGSPWVCVRYLRKIEDVCLICSYRQTPGHPDL